MEKIAKMAMLDTGDVKRLWKDVEAMLETAEALNELDGSECPGEAESTLRKDEPQDFCEELLQNAPVVKDGYIAVPKVVGK